ncbi:hypothetical protein evm_014694 [Chilo suppressalis]|nr:hypothetical protein evm_014694 [Chilo suppressalis]
MPMLLAASGVVSTHHYALSFGSWLVLPIPSMGKPCAPACAKNLFENIDNKYHLVKEAYRVAKNLFNQGRSNYNRLKSKSLQTVDTFLDLVKIMNAEMARELRSAVVKFYKIKYFNDFTNYVISLEEMIDITEHCLLDPLEKLVQIRDQFHHVIRNFEDVRQFDRVNKCHKELPDEVAAAHCILHQAVLLVFPLFIVVNGDRLLAI